MTGRILIADDGAGRRILLRADAAEALQGARATTRAAALSGARAAAVDAGRVGLGAPAGAGLGRLRAFRSDPRLADLPLIARLPRPDPALRRAALAAGADDVLARPAPAAALLPRLRSLLRSRHVDAELWERGEATLAELAEPAPGFEPQGTIALVADPALARRWRDGLAPRMRDRLVCTAPADVLSPGSGGAAAAQVFVVALGPGPAAPALRLIADLRARRGGRDARILAVPAGPAAGAEAEAAALDMGADGVLPPDCAIDEMALRLRRELARGRRREALRRRLADGLRLAATDPLTGLPNRRAGLRRLDEAAAASALAGQPCAVMVIDIDRFKAVNDGHGHAAGDLVLAEVARRIAGSLRLGDTAARLGGEEFLAILPGAGPQAARAVAERLRAAVSDGPVTVAGGAVALRVTVSVGVAVAPRGSAAAPEALLAEADAALYASKLEGRNLVTLGRSAA